jgi:hypothetical protein
VRPVTVTGLLLPAFLSAMLPTAAAVTRLTLSPLTAPLSVALLVTMLTAVAPL